MDYAKSAEEVVQLFNNNLKEIEGVKDRVNDTLNINNGMNYAQFLEAILRIACARSENAGVPFIQAYKANLE